MTLFSIRYRRALRERSLRVAGFSQRLRKRLWLQMSDFDRSLDEVSESGYSSWTSTLRETQKALLRAYGLDALEIVVSASPRQTRRAKDLEQFFMETYPSEVLDTVEAFFPLLDGSAQEAFGKAVNEIFREEECPWRFSEGTFFQVDSEFMAALLATTSDRLRAGSFQGAHDELREARQDLQAGDHKDAILKAGKSMESALKTVLGRSDGNASDLLAAFQASGYLDDLPEELRGMLTKAVLMALPTLRNKLGGHGQGAVVVAVSRPYAELAVHLAGAFLRFIVEKHVAAKPPQKPSEPDDDLVPF